MDAFFKKAKPTPAANADIDMETTDHLMATAQAKPKYIPWIEK
jgi:hypothetical protein